MGFAQPLVAPHRDSVSVFLSRCPDESVAADVPEFAVVAAVLEVAADTAAAAAVSAAAGAVAVAGHLKSARFREAEYGATAIEIDIEAVVNRLRGEYRERALH